jgi:ectoine hydroxylase-related dioxygenase (phytanoyl-CoA dioxygenase family)
MTRMAQRSKTFREVILEHDLVHGMGDAMFAGLGAYWLTTAQVIEIGPGNKPQPLHRDIENWPAFPALGPQAPEFIVNFLVALTDFTDANGGTRVVPGSHVWPDFSDHTSHEATIPVEMKAGDTLFFSGKLLHGGGPNRTADERRRALALPLQAGFLTPEEPWPFVADMNDVRLLSPRAQRLIGFRSLYNEGGVGLWQVDSNELAQYLEL